MSADIFAVPTTTSSSNSANQVRRGKEGSSDWMLSEPLHAKGSFPVSSGIYTPQMCQKYTNTILKFCK